MRYRIAGVDRQSGRQVSEFFVEASNEKSAVELAAARGVMVESVTEDPDHMPTIDVPPTPTAPKKPPPTSFTGNDIVGVLLVVGGALGMLYAYAMPQSAPNTDVVNYGLLNDRLVVAVLSSAAFLAGAVEIGATQICREVQKLGRANP